MNPVLRCNLGVRKPDQSGFQPPLYLRCKKACAGVNKGLMGQAFKKTFRNLNFSKYYTKTNKLIILKSTNKGSSRDEVLNFKFKSLGERHGIVVSIMACRSKCLRFKSCSGQLC